MTMGQLAGAGLAHKALRLLESQVFRLVDGSFLLRFLFAGLICGAVLMAADPATAARIRHPVAVFAGLDKITGRTIAFEANSGETVQFGTLQITERACYTHPATEAPETATFIEVDEVSPGNQYKRIFSGWMFAASPGLHAIEHPIYDIWLTNCAGDGTLEPGPEAKEEGQPSQAALAPAPAEGTPAPARKQSRRHHRGEPPENPAPAAGFETSEPPQPEQAGGGAPPLGEPIEVGPPPGLIPGPQEGRHAPVQRFYPADPSGPLDDPGGDPRY